MQIIKSAVLFLWLPLCGCNIKSFDSAANVGSASTSIVSPTSSLRIAPLNSTRRCLETLAFTSSLAVSWSVNGVAGGNSTVGTISASGLYTTPGNPPAATVTVTATTVANPVVLASATVTLLNAVPVITAATTPVVAGAPIVMTVQGEGFANGTIALLGSTRLNVVWKSNTQLLLTGTVPMPVGGTANLAISNPAPGPARSNLFPIRLEVPSGMPTLALDAANNQHAISPNIYGIAYGPGLTPPAVAVAKQIALPTIRWGGDAATNYNWMADTTNAGSDHYFINFRPFYHAFTGSSYSPDQMITEYAAASPGSHALITVPINPWVASGDTTQCSYPVAVYGSQQATLTLGNKLCGDGISAGKNLIDNTPSTNYVANSVAMQQGWIEHLVSKFGLASAGGVAFYQLDNEPSAWHGPHRDLQPVQPLYDQITALGIQYAAMIKSVDKSAKVLGPSDFTEYGWVWYTPTGSSLNAAQYYLQQMADYEAANNTRILDDFDEHWQCPDMFSATAELNSTRTLWDPSYNANSSFEQYVHGPIMMLPRFEGWVGTYYPGTRISISEYECVAKPGSPTITDALAEADILGIFGAWDVDLANNFNIPKVNDPLAFSYMMYRNYDGKGSQFGNLSVSATSTVPSSLAAYGAVRSADGALTVIVINKTAAAIGTTLSLANFSAEATGSSYVFSESNLTQIVAGAMVHVASGIVSYNFPANSITLLVLPPA